MDGADHRGRQLAGGDQPVAGADCGVRRAGLGGAGGGVFLKRRLGQCRCGRADQRQQRQQRGGDRKTAHGSPESSFPRLVAGWGGKVHDCFANDGMVAGMEWPERHAQCSEWPEWPMWPKWPKWPKWPMLSKMPNFIAAPPTSCPRSTRAVTYSCQLSKTRTAGTSPAMRDLTLCVNGNRRDKPGGNGQRLWLGKAERRSDRGVF